MEACAIAGGGGVIEVLKIYCRWNNPHSKWEQIFKEEKKSLQF